MSEKKVYNLFSAFAPIHSIVFPTEENRNKGFCFIPFYCNSDVETVIEKMNGSTVQVWGGVRREA